jgi:hypothetical protein
MRCVRDARSLKTESSRMRALSISMSVVDWLRHLIRNRKRRTWDSGIRHF